MARADRVVVVERLFLVGFLEGNRQKSGLFFFSKMLFAYTTVGSLGSVFVAYRHTNIPSRSRVRCGLRHWIFALLTVDSN